MKGLIIKDLYMIKKQLLINFIIAFGLTFLFIFGGENANFLPLILSAFIFSSTIVNLLSYDDFEKWNIFTFNLPVTRKQVVTEKYLLLAIMLIPYLFISFCELAFLRFDFKDILSVLFILIITSSIMPIILFPIYFKFGYRKAKTIVFIIIITTAIIFSIFSQFINLINLNSSNSNLLIISIILFMIIIFSYIISIKVYEKREF